MDITVMPQKPTARPADPKCKPSLRAMAKAEAKLQDRAKQQQDNTEREKEVRAKYPLMDAWRLHLGWLRAIRASDDKEVRGGDLPFRFDHLNHIRGERYFLSICQLLWRQFIVQVELNQESKSELAAIRAVTSWADEPLTAEIVTEEILDHLWPKR